MPAGKRRLLGGGGGERKRRKGKERKGQLIEGFDGVLELV